MDYGKRFAFKRLPKSLDDRTTKCFIRDGEPGIDSDANFAVGDILSVNSHSLVSVSADVFC